MGILDALYAQTPQGEALRGGLLNMGAGLLAGSVGNGGQFAPAMAQGMTGFQSGMQNAQKNAMMQQELARKQQMQQLQMLMAQRLQGGAQPSPGGQAAPGQGSAAGQPGATPSAGAPSPGMSFNDYQTLMALGVPGAKEAFEAYKYANPVERRQGNTYLDPVSGQERYMPQLPEGATLNNGQVALLPGYANTIAQTEAARTGATEAAKYPYTVGAKREDAALDPMKYFDPAGLERYGTRAQIAGSAQAGQAPLASADVKAKSANELVGLASEASKYLDAASNGLISSALTGGGEVFGISSPSSKADAQLKTIAGQMVAKMPRFEGPQSDKDVQVYREMAGNVGDSSVPIETRKAALRAIIELNDKYLQSRGMGGGAAQPASGSSGGGFSNLWGG